MPKTPGLLLFSKYPHPGRVKTRLIPELGETGAARVAQAFLLDLAERLSKSDLGITRRFLLYDPPDALEQFQTLLAQTPGILEHFTLLAQAQGSLGERLAAAAENAQELGSGPLIFIGNDAPDLPLAHIQTGILHALNGRAYLLPAHDGGYAALSLPAAAPLAVFEQIAWSTPQTAQQQAQRLRALNVPLVVSPECWWDVDEPGDLQPLRERLASNPAIAPRTHMCLADLR